MANPENLPGAPDQAARPRQQQPRPQSHPNVRVLEGLLETKKPRDKKKPKLMRTRHWLIAASFVSLVAIPTTAASLYMAFIAADQYHSAASFSVRSIDSAAMTSDILGMFSQTATNSTASDSYILSDYIHSTKMAAEVDAKFDLETVYAPRGLDYVFGLATGNPIEDKAAYWQDMTSISFDHSSGIMELEVKAFDPTVAQEIAKFVLSQCEKLINDLSITAREEALKTAHHEIEVAEQRLARARLALRQFRDSSQELDPVEGAKLATQLIGAMEQQLAQLNTDLATALTQMGEDTPRVRVLKAQIDSLQAQVEQERQRIGSGSSDQPAIATKSGRPVADQAVSGRIQVYEELETEREFAERTYTAALAALEKARIESAGKQRYLATFIEPSLSEYAQYPQRLLHVALVLLGGLFAWAMITLGYYNIRDRA